MNAMEILVRCRDAEGDKKRIQGKIQRYRDSAASVTSFVDANGGGHSTGEKDKMAFFTGEIDQLERDLQQRDKEYSVEIQAACKLLDMIPEKEGHVLHQYYVRGLTLQAIADENYYSYGYARKAKSEGDKQVRLISSDAVLPLLPKWYIDQHKDTKP